VSQNTDSMGVSALRTTGYPPPDHGVQARGFAVILHESEYLDLIARHPALDRGDYADYLAGVHRRMLSAQRTGRQVLIGPFLTDQYESYAEAICEPPCSTETLRSYDDFVARIGPYTTAWSGEPIGRVLARLREATDISADQARLLPLLKRAADLHLDPERAADRALDAATELFAPLIRGTEPGHHTLTCAVEFPGERVTYVLPVVRTKELVAFPDGGPEQLLWAALATAQLADRPATLVLRSRRLRTQERCSPAPPNHTDSADLRATPSPAPSPSPSPPPAPSPSLSPSAPPLPTRSPQPLTVRAWRLSAGHAVPLTAGQVFALACTDPDTGDLIPPEPGAEYIDAFPIERHAP
jgi:hypothetical protein